MQNNELKDSTEDLIKWTELFNIFWLNKKFIVIFTSFAAMVSVFYSLSLTNIYTAQTVMVPTSPEISSSLASQYGNLASMAGINIPQGGLKNQTEVALNLIKSKKLIDRLMLYESFLPDLFAARKWDLQSNIVTYDEALYDSKNKKWIRKVSPPFKQTPSSQEALNRFLALISISQNRKTRLITLQVDHLSPVVAHQWSLWIVKETNAILANSQIIKSKASIEYLNRQIKITPYSELKTMFYNLIQESTQSMMLASVNPEYVLSTIDPPVIPERKSKPKRSSVCILGTILGGMLSILIVLIRRYGFNKEDELNIFRFQ